MTSSSRWERSVRYERVSKFKHDRLQPSQVPEVKRVRQHIPESEAAMLQQEEKAEEQGDVEMSDAPTQGSCPGNPNDTSALNLHAHHVARHI